MNLVHLVDEISDKNQSILSIIKLYSKFTTKKSTVITASKKKRGEEFNKVFFLKNFIYDFLKYFSNFRNIIINSKPSVIHIHGLWRPIYFFSIIYCYIFSVPFIIQPHGMLLLNALKSGNKMFYYGKIYLLFIYKIFLKKAYFLSVTKEESLSIKKYFPESNVEIINNPIDLYRISKIKTEKKFVFFGRIHRIKNIDLIIKGFEMSNPGQDWKLEIYGIKDDENYYEFLKNIINQSKYSNNISLKKPIFGRKKFKTLSSAWCNILISQSEILSLSAVESMSVGTPTLINNKIYFPKYFKKNLFNTNLKIRSISQNMRSIMNMNLQKLRLKKKNIRGDFLKLYSINDIKKNYVNLMNKINFNYKNNSKKLNEDKFAVLTTATLSNSLNLFFIPYLVILYTLVGKPHISADLGIVSGTVLIISYFFSANARVLLLSYMKSSMYSDFLIFRIFISSFIFLLFFSLFPHFDILGNYQNNLLVIIILLSWINEINLTNLESNKSKIVLSVFILFYTFSYIFSTLSILLEIENLEKIFNYIIVFHVFFYLFSSNLTSENISLKNQIKVLNVFKSLSLWSSITNIFSVLTWRFSIYFLYDKFIAGIFISAFSLASFPGTLMNNIVAPSFIRIKFSRETISRILFLLFFMFLLISAGNIYYKEKLDLFYNILLISLIGTIFMSIAIYLKNYLIIEKNYLQNKVFISDIIYSLSILPLVIILHSINEYHSVKFAYLISGIFSLFVYLILFKKYGKNN